VLTQGVRNVVGHVFKLTPYWENLAQQRVSGIANAHPGNIVSGNTQTEDTCGDARRLQQAMIEA
jgi:hypothetical protein